jgi:single-strand DNA-binding protein
MSYARIEVIGRLGRDPELKQSTTGTMVLKFSVAVDIGWGDRHPPQWWTVTVFGKRAESLHKILAKGREVLAAGEPQIRQYESREDGRKVSMEIIAQDVILVGSRPKSDEQPREERQPEPSKTSEPAQADIPYDDESAAPF